MSTMSPVYTAGEGWEGVENSKLASDSRPHI